jgi:hypothetical protein
VVTSTEANLHDAHRRRRYHQPDVVLRLQEAWKGDDELMKTNLTLNGVGGQPGGDPGCHLHGAHHTEQITRYYIVTPLVLL